MVAALVAVGVALLVDAPTVVVPQIAVLYAATGYYTARHPDVLHGGDGPRPDWTAGALGGGLTFALVGLTTVDAPPWLYVYGFGLAVFGVAVGVAWARSRPQLA